MIRPSAVFTLLLLVVASCTEAKRGPSPEERDRDALSKVVSADLRASQAMRDADEAATKGDAGAALDIVTSRATPAVDEGLGMLDHASIATDWGKKKREAIGGVLHDRKAEMPKYEEAVKSGDLERLVSAMQAQARIERRALATVADMKDGR